MSYNGIPYFCIVVFTLQPFYKQRKNVLFATFRKLMSPGTGMDVVTQREIH
jgi:hypothetical protein